MIINPHTGEIDESFLTEIHVSAIPSVRISDAGDEFLIVYFYELSGGLETGVIRVIKSTFETYNQVLISWNSPHDYPLNVGLVNDVFYVGGDWIWMDYPDFHIGKYDGILESNDWFNV